MTTTTGAAPAPKEARREHAVGVPFEKGHHIGRPKGSIDRRRLAGQMAAKAIEGRAWDVVLALLSARAWRPRFEAARLVLAYSIGSPRMTLELTGGISDLSRELSEALKAARERRAALDSVQVTQACRTLPQGSVASSGEEAPALEVEVLKVGTEGEP